MRHQIRESHPELRIICDYGDQIAVYIHQFIKMRQNGRGYILSLLSLVTVSTKTSSIETSTEAIRAV
jgi:hypothetical protein